MTINVPPIDAAELGNVEIEQALLGAIIVSQGEAFDRVSGVLTAEDFSEGIHQNLYRCFEDARANGRGIGVDLSVAALGGSAGQMISPALTVGQYVGRLAAAATTIVGAHDYALTVRDFSDKRKILGAMNAVRDIVASGNDATSAALTGVEMLDGIAANRPGSISRRMSIGKAAVESVERMNWALTNPGKISGQTWGLRDLDAKTNGLQAGELIILAGRPGMGKSGLALSSARQAALAGVSSLYFSLEMKAAALATRALSDACFDPTNPIPYFDIDRGSVTNEQGELVIDEQRRFDALPLQIDDTSGLSVGQIAARARRYKQAMERKGRRLDVVWVDHMHLVRASERYSGNRVQEVTETSGALKALAKDLGIPVVALAQLSRNVETRDDKRPMLSDLRDSGSIEQDADLIAFLYREAYYLERTAFDKIDAEDARISRLAECRNSLEVLIAKQRNGPTGTVPLFFNAPCNAARDMARAR